MCLPKKAEQQWMVFRMMPLYRLVQLLFQVQQLRAGRKSAHETPLSGLYLTQQA